MEKTIKPIAYIKNGFKQKFGIPRQSGRVPEVMSEIIFYPEFRSKDALRELETFSHLWLIFGFSQNEYKDFVPTVRPPRLGGNKKVGVFASRASFRPNGLGLSSVKLIKIKNDKENGQILVVSGADLLSDTPIYDIKPYLPSTDCHLDAIGGYADKFTNYELTVVIPNDIKNKILLDDLPAIIGCLKEDPRPSYKDDDNEYGMFYKNYNVKFYVKDKTLTVTDIEII